MSRFIICCLVLMTGVCYAVEPYSKIDVPWAVYLPENAGDTKGDTDATAFLHGDDVKGWYTYMVFKADGTHITNNADLYASSTPIINEEDDYGKLDLSKDPDYIICKFILVQPAKTPSHGIDGAPLSSSFVDTATRQLTFGHEEHALHYNSVERKIENVTIAGDYWLAARETQKKLWRVIYGDSLHTPATDTLSQEIANVITSKAEYSAGNDKNELMPVSDINNFVVKGAPANSDQRYIKHEFPVLAMNWDETHEFLRKLGIHTGGKQVRLPNEYEWEYAARSGDTAEFPSGFFGDQLNGWIIADPSDSNDTPLSIESVFGKVYQIPDVPRTVTDEYFALTQVGTNPDGSPIMENKIIALRFVIDPRLEAKRDFRIVIGGTINYDNRYPANMTPFGSRNFWLHSDGSSFISANVVDQIDGDGTKTGVKLVSTRPNTQTREFYADEDSLARAVNNYYIGVKEDGSYAARKADPGDPTSPYVYDPEIVHHFVKLTGEDIWPPSQPGSSPMNINNTVLSYLYWRGYDKNVTFLGGFSNPIPLYEQSRDELINKVTGHAFPNSPGDYDYKGKVHIPAKSTMEADYNKVAGDDKDSIAVKIDIPEAHGGDKNHKWYYVRGWNTHGKTLTKNQHDAILNGDPKPARQYPIDGFYPGASPREKPYKVTMLGNSWGFENMLGNAAEYVLPVNQTSDAARWDGLTNYEYYVDRGRYVIIRGGGWNSDISGIRYSSRKAVLPTARGLDIGFRILIEQ